MTSSSRRTRAALTPRLEARTGPVGIGVIGAGMISDTYLNNLTSFPDVIVHAIGDIDPARAAAQAATHSVECCGSADAVLAHPDVEIVVNLTIPAVHAQVSSACVQAGKHVWSEKPLSTDRASARELLDQAHRAGVIVGVAPDTILGPGFQSARRMIARGDIGTPTAAATVMQYPGPDIFHPHPEFLFARGGGPLYDFGPYYLTALVHIFGSIASVSAVGTRSRERRVVQAGERAGVEFPVEVPTHVSALARFTDGGISQSLLSFDSPLARMGVIEVTGTEGTMLVPDPNNFDGDIKITRAATMDTIFQEPLWSVVPAAGPVAGRGTGVLDMARVIRAGHGQPVASGTVGYHVLDAMISIDEAIEQHTTVPVASQVGPVGVLDQAWDPFTATL
ncbi:MAG: Gfo/Idh/MocA family protein [Arachnia sp.]